MPSKHLQRAIEALEASDVESALEACLEAWSGVPGS